MYKVIYPFWDMQDKTKHDYKIGDFFPYDGRKISKSRLDELSSTDNKIGKVLIYLDDLSKDNDATDNAENQDKDNDATDNTENQDKDNFEEKKKNEQKRKK